MSWVKQFAKAIYAGAVTFLGALAVLLVDGVGFADISAGAWVTMALATVVAIGGVYQLTNTP